jgi:hypothetical protein
MAPVPTKDVPYVVEQHEDWIEKDGKPAVKFVNEVRTTLTLVKVVVPLIGIGQLISIGLQLRR